MTDNNTTNPRELKELGELLATHGADRTRWPAPERLRFAGLIASDPAAQRLLSEAAALDRLLDLAPAPTPASRALADRIVTAAAREPGLAPVSGILVPTRRRSTTPWSGRGQGIAISRFNLPAAALLAASLVLGTFAGTSGALNSALEPLTTEASLVSYSESDPSQLALGSDTDDLLEEDNL